jgi:hypothetical protein
MTSGGAREVGSVRGYMVAVWEFGSLGGGGAEMCKRREVVGTLVKYPRERDMRENDGRGIRGGEHAR